MKMLIIEDYPASLKLISVVLLGSGHVVSRATSADQAIYGTGEALKSGCDAYIVKPIHTRTLLQQIEDVVAAKAQTSLPKARP